MKTICAFSSDSRDLYKADIYRTLSLPEGHTLHFRYKKAYVSDNVISAGKSILGSKVCIFFSHGNTGNADTSPIQNTSIRWASIVDVELSDHTDVFHIYMRLDDFCNVSLSQHGDSVACMPPFKFLSSLELEDSQSRSNWSSRIELIKSHFPKMTFFHIKGILDSKKKPVPLSIDDQHRSCRYELYHGTDYTLQLAISNPTSSDTKIEIYEPNKDLIINCITPFESSIRYDDHDIPFFIKNLPVHKQSSFLTFKPLPSTKEDSPGATLGEYATNVEISLKLDWETPVKFGFFSTLAFWGILIAEPMTTAPTGIARFDFAVGSALFFVASTMLFFWFNKK